MTHHWSEWTETQRRAAVDETELDRLREATALYKAALGEIAGRAPQKPDGPYDEYGGYCSDDLGDVISAATDAEAWTVAEIARAALNREGEKL